MAKRTKAPVDASVETETSTIDTVTVEMPSDDEVLAALEQADAAASQIEEIETVATEEVDVTLEEADEDAILAELEASQDDTTTSKPKRKSSPKAASAPVVTREFCDVADHMDDSALKAALDSINAKKVAEKASNLVQAVTSGKRLSGFTQLAVKKLVTEGRVSGKTLVEAYQQDGKSLGTARAQSQQMTALFKALGIAQPDPSNPRELVAADNGLVRELEKLAA
jgi:hypothetical protein